MTSDETKERLGEIRRALETHRARRAILSRRLAELGDRVLSVPLELLEALERTGNRNPPHALGTRA